MIYTIRRSPELNCGYYDFLDTSWVIISKNNRYAALEDIKVSKDIREGGLGTVLLLCAVTWALDEGLSVMNGSFSPEKGMKDTVTIWYDKRGISITGTRLSGNLGQISNKCQSLLKLYDAHYQVVNS